MEQAEARRWQIDWILGANPYDICFLHGSGDKNPPAYASSKLQGGTLPGGIANGITGKEKDGSGIQWPADNNGWRWVEQWLPHAAWYMVAVTALARKPTSPRAFLLARPRPGRS